MKFSIGERKIHYRTICRFGYFIDPPGGGGGHSLVSSVPMRDQKNDEKGYFFSRRAVRSADII